MKKNLLDELIDLKGGVQNAVEYLNRRGVKVTIGRYNQWLSGRFHPKYETISIILEEITDFTLSPLPEQHSDENIVLKHTIPVTELRQKLPHRRFANNYWQRVRYVDSQILEAVHGHDVWTRFEAMCGNFECARYVLRRNLNEHTITDSWIQKGSAPFSAIRNNKTCCVKFTSKRFEKEWQEFCKNNELKNDPKLEY